MTNKYDTLIDNIVFNNQSEIPLSDLEELPVNKIKEEVEFRKKLVEEFESKEVLEISKRLDHIHEEYVSSNKKKTYPWLIYILVAMSLAGLGYLLSNFFNTNKMTGPQMYAQYFEIDKINAIERESQNENLLELQQAFNNENYATALHKLNQLIKTDSNPEWRIYRGISLLKLDRGIEARKDFMFVSDTKNILWGDQADWYLALSYLKTSNTSQARVLLESLSGDPEADFHMQAKELLAKF